MRVFQGRAAPYLPGDNRKMTSERSYHHGNLRDAALGIARTTVEQRGHDAVAMRELALQLQVSPAALYRHFSNRTALLCALADETHEALRLQLVDVIADHTDPWDSLEAACRAFLAFSDNHVRLFRMMYDDEVINAPDAEAQLPALAHTYRLMLQLFRQALPQAGIKELRLRLIAMWSALFGYASVRAQGMLKSYMMRGLSGREMERAVLAAALGARAG